jgi:hypothetical protein
VAYKLNASQQKDLNRAINNFNRKVKRLESVDREIDIPEKANITAIKDRITNKWELNREIDRLERFTQRNAEELIKNKSGVVLSRWEYENLQREQKRLNARLLREIERYGNITPKEFGKKQSATYSQMGDEKLSNLKARQKAISSKSLSKINRQQLKSLETLINKTNANYRKDKELFYNNYLDGTLINLGYYVGYDEEKLNYIKEKLNELTPDQFIKAFNTDVSLKDIQDRYVLSHEDGITPEILEADVAPVLDELYNNLDDIVASYK